MLDAYYALLRDGDVLSLFFEVVPITLLVGVLYALCRLIRLKRRGRPVRWGAEVMGLLLACYLTGLINLVLVPANFWGAVWFRARAGYWDGGVAPFFSGSWNFMPTLLRVLRGEYTMGSWVRTMLAGNFLMFLPFGVLLPFRSERLTPRVMWKLALLVPIAVEVLQPVVGRSFDIDDVLLNAAGALLGYALWYLAARLFPGAMARLRRR